MEKFDLIIIGAGAAGFAAAIRADELGAKTLMVNNTTVGLGGTCVNEGCFPTKHLLAVSGHIHNISSERFKGIESHLSVDFRTIMDGKNKLVAEAVNDKYKNVLSGLKNIRFMSGNAMFRSDDSIVVGKEEFCADKIIIATGSSTSIPHIEGIENVPFMTNREALLLEKLPQSMIVIGGGAIGIEFAQMFSRFGSKVTVVEYAEKIMAQEEPELTQLLGRYLKDEGIKILTGARVISAGAEGDSVSISVEIEGNTIEINAEKILIAAGRKPNIHGFGIERTGVRTGEKSEILIDSKMQAAENIYAAGDVTGMPMLETVAAKEGNIAAHNALSLNENDKIKIDRRVTPRAVFSDPQLAGVGYTDYEANELGFSCRCSTIPLKVIPKALAINNTEGAVKIVTDAASEEILGIHILAPFAAELIHEGVMIIKNRMTLDEVIDTLHIFPTLSEGIKIAAQSFKRDVTKMSCCIQ